MLQALRTVLRRTPSPAASAESSTASSASGPSTPPAVDSVAFVQPVGTLAARPTSLAPRPGALLPPDAHSVGSGHGAGRTPVPQHDALQALAAAYEVSLVIWQRHDWSRHHPEHYGVTPRQPHDPQHYLQLSTIKGGWRQVHLCYSTATGFAPMAPTTTAGVYALGSDALTVQGEHNLECAFAEAAALAHV